MPLRPDTHHLSDFFDSLQGRREGLYGVPPEVPNDRFLSGVFGGLDDRRQGQGAPASPETPPWPYSPEAPDGSASTSPGASDTGNVAPSTRSPPEPNCSF